MCSKIVNDILIKADMSDEDDDDDDDEEDDGADEEWKESERDQFRFYRDRNGDGKLDPEEVKHWIIPEDYDNSQAEAKHLMMESDEDKVGLAVQTEMVATVYHRTTSNSNKNLTALRCLFYTLSTLDCYLGLALCYHLVISTSE